MSPRLRFFSAKRATSKEPNSRSCGAYSRTMGTSSLSRSVPAELSKSPRKNRTICSIWSTIFLSCSLSGGLKVLRKLGAGKFLNPRSRARTRKPSLLMASAAVTVSSSINSLKTSPSGLKKKRSASLTVRWSLDGSTASVPPFVDATMLEDGCETRNLPPSISVSRSEISTVWEPEKSPACPTDFLPLTPPTLNAVPSDSSRTAENFSTASNKSITFSALNAPSRP
mmetsp:Transcript_20894/g.26993  ORF Transcript_20894/g.26993 Transcript_20894/m.26993 type:complete len:226 (-) Transcript_20894:1106-1783(-)